MVGGVRTPPVGTGELPEVAMMGFGTVDQDGDAEMTVLQPMFEFIKSPKLTAWSQPALVRFLRDHRQYLSKMYGLRLRRKQCDFQHQGLCRTTNPGGSSSLRARTPVAEVEEEALKSEMERKVANTMNDHVSNVAKLLAEKLKMDLTEPNIEARVSMYFMDFEQLVEYQALPTRVGRGSRRWSATNEKSLKAAFSKMLIEVLCIDIARLVDMNNRKAKPNDIALYDLIVEMAVRQQHYHLMQAETKMTFHAKPKKGQSDGISHNEKPRDTAKASERKGISSALKNGCPICKGPHRDMEYPTATSEQKDEARRTFAARTAERLKVDTGVSTGYIVTINGVLEVPFCADSGSESNILSRSMVDELCVIDSIVTLMAQKPPRIVKVADDTTIACRDRVECLVLDGDEEEFLLGLTTMKDIGIGVNSLLEQLACGASVAQADNDDVTEGDPELGFDDERKGIHGILDKVVDDAVNAGFDSGLANDLRALVHKYADVWQIRIGADEPARVKPIKITLRTGA
ncbi:hypothetical protein PHPALM_31476 [Phytophthora palmivora]|uniref:Uncharacterized protein n=1 Tax=Phytophthora palmivora TaxID=4796 RepID=A0A2P4X2G7_9STRA|nr:hypothetical protein PHPALM_31476 [Phytophthora palmivora]